MPISALVLGLAMAAMLSPSVLVAQPAVATTEPHSPRAVVMLLPGHTEPGPCNLELEAVQNQLADLTTAVELAPLGNSTTGAESVIDAAQQIAIARAAVLVFWIPYVEPAASGLTAGCAAASRVYLYAPDSEGGRILVRDLGEVEPGSEAQREALGVIVRSTLRALLLGEKLQGAKVSPAAPEKIQKPTPARTWHLDFLAHYGLWGLSNQIPVGHGARLGLDAAGERLLLGVAIRLNARGRTNWTDLSIERRSVAPELLAAVHLGKGRARLKLSASAFIERSELRVTSAPSGVELQSGAARWVPGLSPGLGVSVQVVRTLWLDFEIGADYPLEKTKYVVRQDGRDHVALEGWNARPFARIGGRFAFWRMPSVRR